jgi:hypothetical protein
MKLRAAAALLIPLFFAFSAHAFSGADATPTPGFLNRTMDETLQILHLKHAAHRVPPANIHHDIELKLDISPSDFSLSDTRQVQATVDLFNRSKKNYVHLDFPTSQRIEILVRDSSGKVVNTWSEDQSFTADPATITVNPGERLEYTASVATREMSPGQPYSIEVSFPNYPELKIEQRVSPRK